LGHRFLGHVERCAVMLHLIDATEEDILGNWRTIRGELEAYGHGLTEKPEIIALNKADAVPPEELTKKHAKLKRAAKRPIYIMSGATGQGVDEVLTALLHTVQAAREAEAEKEQQAASEPVLAP
jgi:GTP-binding protein